MTRRIWNCEHCGKDVDDPETVCDYCTASMCDYCTCVHDDDEICPNTAPIGVPGAAVRDAQLQERERTNHD